VVIISQSEILEFLENNKGEWWTCKKVAQILEVPDGRIIMGFKKLRDARMVNFKMYRPYLYKYKSFAE